MFILDAPNSKAGVPTSSTGTPTLLCSVKAQRFALPAAGEEKAWKREIAEAQKKA
jgi:hypothetical protein